MRRLYAELGGDPEAIARPVLDVVIEGMAEAPLRCLVDSGAVNTLVPSWVAFEAGINLERIAGIHLGVGGGATTARFTSARLAIGDHAWEARIGFCDPWPYGWGLLGQIGFFHFFAVTFRAANWELEIEPISG
jgi:hypothetical protein